MCGLRWCYQDKVKHNPSKGELGKPRLEMDIRDFEQMFLHCTYQWRYIDKSVPALGMFDQQWFIVTVYDLCIVYLLDWVSPGLHGMRITISMIHRNIYINRNKDILNISVWIGRSKRQNNKTCVWNGGIIGQKENWPGVHTNSGKSAQVILHLCLHRSYTWPSISV